MRKFHLALVFAALALAAADAHPQNLRDRLFGGKRPGLNNPEPQPGSNSRKNNRPTNSENPLFPAFTATRATEATQNAPQQMIRFEHIITNEGAGFNRGEFTVPSSGLYVFSWSAVSPQGRSAKISLTKNARELDVHSWGEQDGFQSFSNTAVLNLRSGDRVALRLSEGEIYEPNGTKTGYTTFTGYRIG